ncbi:esterase/lipase family protein [Vibrio sp.]|uniref:esterase/lipase family protein n=1 Tax=Vibrio sp. TaxID=678 RepID=UPI003AA82BE3
MSKIHHMSGDRKASKHVILIHGLGGHYKNTWSCGRDKNVFWPAWLTENESDVCVWSIEYESKVAYFIDDAMPFKDQAANIAENLFIKNDLKTGEIIFIGHSMGGLIIKQVIRIAEDRKYFRDEANQLLSRVTGTGFIGTPHTGSDLSTIGNMLPVRLAMRLIKLSPSAATLYLFRNNPDLRELNTWFRDWERQYRISTMSLGETKKTRFTGWIVKPDSADAGLTSHLIPVEKDHNSICKPDDREDQIYLHIESFIFKEKTERQTSWLRENVGKHYSGWSGYGNWTGPDSNAGYIIDEKVKFSDAGLNADEKVTAERVIDSVRNRLREAGASLRLVGLSGVGKTRFAQALFEPDTGLNPLSQESVFYTDTARNPDPVPSALLEKLVSSGVSAVLIVDNCGSDLHRTLTEQLAKDNGFVSLLTIEYDIREDIPENTHVIIMDAGSDELIQELIKTKYKHIGLHSIHKIAEFSGGNARVAIALASAIGRDDDISRLKNAELFRRLFNQRQAAEEGMQKSAEALSLVYSFQLESEEGNSEELDCLSRLSGVRYDTLLRNAKELRRRGLAQTRSIWMAVLPHSIANGLAQLALENMSHAKVSEHINPRLTPRMFSSLTRRLGYLSKSPEASSYAASLLTPDGVFETYIAGLPVSKNSGYTQCFTMISNLAPVVPSETLDFLGRMAERDNTFCTRENPAFITITRLLRSLAYEGRYFNECASMLYRFTLSEKPSENTNSILHILSSLFAAHLSGTHATPEQRISFIKERIENPRRDISLKLLGSMLQTGGFVSHLGFDFGSSVRDYGYYPESYHEYERWFLGVLNFADETIKRFPDWQSDIIKLLTNRLRGLWDINIDSVRQALYDIIISNLNNKTSPVVWNAISTVFKFDDEKNSLKEKEKLRELAAAASPDSFEKRIELLLFSNEHAFYGLEDRNQQDENKKSGYEIALEKTTDLVGELLSKPWELIDEVISRCLAEQGNDFRMEIFSQNISSKSEWGTYILQKLKETLSDPTYGRQNMAFICGAISGLYRENSIRVEELLDECVNNPITQMLYPALQLSVPLDGNAVQRIKLHLSGEKVDASVYSPVANGQRHASLSDDNLIDLLNALRPCKNGHNCVLDILDMRINHNSFKDYKPSGEIIRYSQDFICSMLHQDKYDHSYHLENLAKRAFKNASAKKLRDLAEAIFSCRKQNIYSFDMHKMLRIVVSENLTIILDLLSPGEGKIDDEIAQGLDFMLYNHPLEESELNTEEVLAWAGKDPDMRFRCLAGLLVPIHHVDGAYKWTELAKSVLLRCNDVETVLAVMVINFRPRATTDGYSARMEEQRVLLTELQCSERADISTAASRLLVQFDRSIQQEKESERREFNSRNVSFE